MSNDGLLRAEETMRDLRYADPLKLGEVMVAAHKAAREGKKSQNSTRLRLEHEVARLNYDMAYLMEESKIMREICDIAIGLSHRVAVLEKLLAKGDK